MEFVSIILISFGTLAVSMGVLDMSRNNCTDIVDIYTTQASYDYAHDVKCPFTKTLVEDGKPEYFIPRSRYDEWAQQFYDLGMKPHYPKRTDTDKVLYYKDFYEGLKKKYKQPTLFKDNE